MHHVYSWNGRCLAQFCSRIVKSLFYFILLLIKCEKGLLHLFRFQNTKIMMKWNCARTCGSCGIDEAPLLLLLQYTIFFKIETNLIHSITKVYQTAVFMNHIDRPSFSLKHSANNFYSEWCKLTGKRVNQVLLRMHWKAFWRGKI